MHEGDPVAISRSFKEQGWNKPVELYLRYLKEQHDGERVVFVAEADGVFAGYVNVVWNSHYPSFQEKGIPEITDLNVLIRFRRSGIGSKLMDAAEATIKERSRVAGIGVGIFSDYGHAQIMYIKRGYVPDGKGIYNGRRYIRFGETIEMNDSIALYLTKNLVDSK